MTDALRDLRFDWT